MVKKRIIITLVGIIASGFILGTQTFCNQTYKQPLTNDADSFLGRWALFLPDGAGWLEVRQEKGYLDGNLLWYGGSVTPVNSILLKNDTLIITRNRDIIRKRDKNHNPVRTHTLSSWIECVIVNGELTGKALIPDETGESFSVTLFSGKRIPPLPPAPEISDIKYGKPIELFNGKDLSGWKLINSKNTNGFRVEEGVLINDPVQFEDKPHIHYGNLRTIGEFEDFNLKVEVNVPQGSNSGIYLRGIYEVQVFDSYQKPLDSHNMGAVYSRITPTISAEKPAGEWQTLDITLFNRHVTVKLNGKLIINNQPLLGVTGGALTADEFSPGPIFLQGDHGKILYRNFVLTPIQKEHSFVN